jgi:hypothetical protein
MLKKINKNAPFGRLKTNTAALLDHHTVSNRTYPRRTHSVKKTKIDVIQRP